MFPHKQKSALVKKEMRVFHRWWGRISTLMDCWSLRGYWHQTRGGKAPGLRAAAGECRHPNAVVTKGHRFDIYAGTPV